MGIEKSVLTTVAIPGQDPGNRIFFRQSCKEGKIVCSYKGKHIDKAAATFEAQSSQFVYQDRTGTTIVGYPDLSYGPSINDGVNYLWDNVKIKKMSDGKLYVVTTKDVDEGD